MTAATFFDVVPMHVAANPVARAIARKKTEAEFTNLALRIHLMADGDDAGADIHATAFVLAVAMKTLELQGQAETAQGRVIAGGMGALRDMAVTGHKWRTRHRNTVDVAVQRAKEALDAAPAKVTQRAYVLVKEMG